MTFLARSAEGAMGRFARSRGTAVLAVVVVATAGAASGCAQPEAVCTPVALHHASRETMADELRGMMPKTELDGAALSRRLVETIAYAEQAGKLPDGVSQDADGVLHFTACVDNAGGYIKP